jgi:hypothetical protein
LWGRGLVKAGAEEGEADYDAEEGRGGRRGGRGMRRSFNVNGDDNRYEPMDEDHFNIDFGLLGYEIDCKRGDNDQFVNRLD